MDRTLHLLPDLELSDGVRLLAQKLALPSPMLYRGDEAVFEATAETTAAVLVLRLCVDWARQRKSFRALRGAGEDWGWANEPLCGLIESACGWRGPAGELVAACVGVGMLDLQTRDEIRGLVFPAFNELNEHLLPGYKTIQQRGGEGKALRRRLREAADTVPQTKQLLRQQGVLLFEQHGMNDEDQDAALSLIARIDTACGRPLRNAGEYKGKHEFLRAALHRARLSTPEEIKSVLEYLMTQQHNPATPRDAELVLREWPRLQRFAMPVEQL